MAATSGGARGVRGGDDGGGDDAGATRHTQTYVYMQDAVKALRAAHVHTYTLQVAWAHYKTWWACYTAWWVCKHYTLCNTS